MYACVRACFLSVRQPFCTGHFEALMLCVCACVLSGRRLFYIGQFEALMICRRGKLRRM